MEEEPAEHVHITPSCYQNRTINYMNCVCSYLVDKSLDPSMFPRPQPTLGFLRRDASHTTFSSVFHVATKIASGPIRLSQQSIWVKRLSKHCWYLIRRWVALVTNSPQPYKPRFMRCTHPKIRSERPGIQANSRTKPQK
jgi:hypothetical protein